ncbi:hypothetical protein ABBQ32_004521 [Trebouxia sp. C0010 RCD-2024]
MSDEVLTREFVRVQNTSEPGAYIVPGVEVFRSKNTGGEGDNDDVVLRFTAKVDTTDFPMTVQTVGRWVQGSTELDLDAAKSFLQQNKSTELLVVTLVRNAQLTGATKISGLEPTRPVNPLVQRMLPDKVVKPVHTHNSTHRRKRSDRTSDSEASVSGSGSFSRGSDSSDDTQVHKVQTS